MSGAAQAEQRILVIDDDETMLALLALTLGEHEVTTAHSREEALTLLKRSEPDAQPTAVLCDLRMPGIATAAFAVRLRAAAPANAVLLAMSASPPVDGEAAVFDGFLRKPFTAEELDEALAGESEAEQGEDGIENADGVLDETTFASLATKMKPEQLRQIYGLCLEDAEKRAGRMEAAAQAGDGAAFVREAHAVKGSCGMLGAKEMQALASRMETGALSCTPLLEDFKLAVLRLRRMLDARI